MGSGSIGFQPCGSILSTAKMHWGPGPGGVQAGGEGGLMETTKAVGGKRLKGRKMHSHPPPTTTQLLSCIPSGSLDFDICISGPWLGFHSGTEQRAVTADTGGFLLVISLAVISDISLCNLPGLSGRVSPPVPVTGCTPSVSLAWRPFGRRQARPGACLQGLQLLLFCFSQKG